MGSRQKKGTLSLFLTLLSTVSKGAVKGGLDMRLGMSNLKDVVLYCVGADSSLYAMDSRLEHKFQLGQFML